MKTRSGLRESPVMTLGDKKEGRSAYSKQSENEENVLARERRTELWRSILAIFKIRLAAGDEVLERFKLEAK